MSDPLTRLAGALADRYRIEGELGQGGMATVYLAHDLRHARKVALKLLRPELAAILGADRFLQEIRTTAALQHPHILPLHDSGVADGFLYYVMPYVQGESLRARLQREKQLPVHDALRIGTEVAGALDYAHRQGVIHRDIKPENILLHDGAALVADFGIALAVNNAGGGRMTETGMSLGTPQYMSPEQAMGERELSARSDVYALGCVCYEMLTGEAPFTGPTAQSIVAKVLTDEPRPLTELRRAVPLHVEAAILTAIEKLPADRFGSAAEFAGALDDSEPRGRSRTTTQRRRAQSATKRSVLVPVLLATTVGAALWGGWETLRSRPAQTNPLVRFTVIVPFNGAPAGGVLALSPDGTRLVVVTRPAGRARWGFTVRRLDQLQLIEFPAIPDPVSPFFSPDGASIAFASGNRLYKVSTEGGTPTTIAELPAGYVIASGSWSHQGSIVFADVGARLWRVTADGAPPVRIGDDSARFNTPSWLPDGKHFLAQQFGGDGSSLRMVAVAASDGRVIAELGSGYSPTYVAPGYLVWLSSEGRILAARFDARRFRLLGQPTAVAEGLSAQARSTSWTVAENGTIAYSAGSWNDKEMVLLSASGTETVLLPLGRQAFRGPRFSPDGRKIAVDVEPGGDLIGDVWVYDRGPGTFSRVTFEGTSVFPEWSPDGKTLIYSAASGAIQRDLKMVRADRSAPPTILLHGESPAFEGILAPDGKTLLYRENARGSRDLYLRRADGTIEPFANTPFAEQSATISPDGRLVLYVSNESGRFEVYLRPLLGSERAQVSVAGGIEPRWTHDGRAIFYRSGDTLFSAPLSTGLEVGPRRVVLTGGFVSEAYHANYDVAPDGSGYVFIRSARSDAPGEVTILLNWFNTIRSNRVSQPGE